MLIIILHSSDAEYVKSQDFKARLPVKHNKTSLGFPKANVSSFGAYLVPLGALGILVLFVVVALKL